MSSGFEGVLVGEILQLAKYLCCDVLVGLGLCSSQEDTDLFKHLSISNTIPM